MYNRNDNQSTSRSGGRYVRRDFLTSRPLTNRESEGNSRGESHRSPSKFNSNGRSNSGPRKFYSNSSNTSSRFSNNSGSFRPRSSRSFGGGPRRNFGRRRIGSTIDHSKYIKKAVEGRVEEVYTPQHKFADFNILPALKKNIIEKGYKDPTPIQDQSIPLILEGKDVIGIANTGTGKTAAFLIPLINKVLKNDREKVLILIPTRELASQINDEFRIFSKFMKIFSVQCIGGASINAQIYSLERRHNFVIGTPGRIKDLINRGYLNLSQFKNIVLDEADRMVDMGFIDDMKFILSKLPSERQSLFFSATISKEIDILIRTFLKDPVTVSVKTQPTSDNVDQDIVKVGDQENKFDKLVDILKQEDKEKVLIFVRTKISADRLDRELYRKGFKVTAIHGDKSQYKRQEALYQFKNNKVNIMVATDVAARGLDIPNVSHVINYDEPENFEDYVHRIGRTGRASNKGQALTFVG